MSGLTSPSAGDEDAGDDAGEDPVLRAHRAVLAGIDGSRLPSRAQVVEVVRRLDPLSPAERVEAVAQRVLTRIEGLGPLAPLLTDPAVTDVLVNGPGPVWVERGGQLEQTAVVVDRDEIQLVLERIVGPLGLRVDRSSPLVDARLPDGSRVNAVVPPLAVDGPVVAIRRFTVHRQPLAAFAAPGVDRFLGWAVRSRRNVVVVGGTGAGKTTLLNALAAEIPTTERLITVEDVAELALEHPHVVRLEARPANADGVGAVAIRDLVRNALRLRPDRIVVGEVRGAEAFDMLQAMNTGHEGSLSTCHANGPADALRRLEAMILLGAPGLPLSAVRDHLSSAVDLVVHVARTPTGTRRVRAVGEPALDTGSAAVSLLTDASGHLVRLPGRPSRRDEAPPSTGWLRPLGEHA